MIRVMNSDRQIAFAQALGVDVWAARKPLRGAAKGHRIATSVSADSLPAAPESQPAVTAKKPGRGRALAQSFAQQQDLPSKQQPPSKAVLQPKQDVKTQPFELFALLHHNVLIVDDISQLRYTASAYNQWLSAIFTALGLDSALAPITANNRISWPLANYAKQYDPAETVRAWLKKKISTLPSANADIFVLAMGERTAHLLGLQGGATSPAQLSEMNQLPALRSAESAKLWQQSTAKRDFWRQLQVIQKLIANVNMGSQ